MIFKCDFGQTDPVLCDDVDKKIGEKGNFRSVSLEREYRFSSFSSFLPQDLEWGSYSKQGERDSSPLFAIGLSLDPPPNSLPSRRPRTGCTVLLWKWHHLRFLLRILKERLS